MAGELEIIDELIAQNRIVRLNLQGMKGAMSDSEALFSVKEARSKLAQSLANKLLDQKRQLQDALSRVQKGLDVVLFLPQVAIRKDDINP